MPETLGMQKEVEQYRSRLGDLYSTIKRWLQTREPDAALSESRVDLVEEAAGPYHVKSLELARPGKPAIRFIPRGIFVVGAHGRVDAHSRLGREILVWVAKGGPALRTEVSVAGQKEIEQITRSLYPGVDEGWAWADEQHQKLSHLTEEVFWDKIIASLSE